MTVVQKVSDPPTLSAGDHTRIQREARQLHDAFVARTKGMELLTAGMAHFIDLAKLAGVTKFAINVEQGKK